MKIENLFNPDNGNEIPNQFRIYTGEGVIFQSYKTIICKIEKGRVLLNSTMIDIKKGDMKEAWKSSKTTSKWLRIFLNEDKETIDNKIKTGQYILTENIGGV
tara:strand:+ start:46 stop:351 length:306 start_codon:yes stop_codon:yes gene_type:complete